MEILIIILAMIAAASFTVSLIVLSKYNSYHTKLSALKETNRIISGELQDAFSLLDEAKKAVQILTDNDNAHTTAISGLMTSVQQLSAAKLTNPNMFKPPARNG